RPSGRATGASMLSLTGQKPAGNSRAGARPRGEWVEMQRRPIRSTVHSCATILVVVGAMILAGCVGNQATATDVNNKSFTFTDGAVFHAALTTIPTTLTFTNNAKIFTLISPGGIATGAAMLSPCGLTVTLSTYPAGTGPQIHDALTLHTCDFDSRTDTLT